MRFEKWNFGWLAFGILLFPGTTNFCSCFQNPTQIQGFQSCVNPHRRTPSMALNIRGILTKLPNKRKRIEKASVSRRKAKRLGVSKYYFEKLERSSGKDYAWIKPLTQPLSHAMRYVISIVVGDKLFRKVLTFLPIFLFNIHRKDMERRSKCYVSDWTDGFKNLKKVIPAIMFLYFACLAPAISFGTIASQITNESIGIVEFLLSAGCSGMVSRKGGPDRRRIIFFNPSLIKRRFLPTARPTPYYVGSLWRSSPRLV